MPHCSAGFERLDEYIGMAMQRQRTPALTLALFDRKETAYSAHYGAADLATQAPIKADTLFGIGSITKSFTAAAMMQAVEEGLVDLTALVATYLPWFRVRTRYEPITVHHLLSHTSGLVGVVDRSPDPRGAVWALRETETAWPPGAHFAYSDAGYQTLGQRFWRYVTRTFNFKL